MLKSFDKVLIANRGEIALRVMRTCHEMGIRAVAVYSDADRTAPHVLMADEAYYIGKSPARDSYLVGERIIETALKCGAQAIHPGYGFLAENGNFAEAVEAAGLSFIGPPAASIRSMGSKTEARRIMIEAGVPVVPGDKSGVNSAEVALASAEKIGYPVLIKAAMGGGGKGMRVVALPDELPAAFEAARRESLSAFSSDEVYLERFIEGPRHIEIQILADSFGNCIHLYERDCSIQRRHQKVIEEAPSPALNEYPHIREQMGEAAVAAALACGYVNAGTVEFLYDPSTNEFFFLEMNTRLQVEHPVTEMVTGIDLVRQQLLIAMGERLELRQENMKHRGHAIECRLYAEDTENGFLPDTGSVKTLVRPSGPWVRVDSGVEEGSEVGVYYDPLVAKLVVWGETRGAAIRRMHRALSEYRVVGLKTNIRFNRWVMDNQIFQSGNFDTRFIALEFSPEHLEDNKDETELSAAVAAVLWEQKRNSIPQFEMNAKPSQNSTQNSWKHAGRISNLR
ncbi:acetyl-CoA carboxylase biotin carboxylase subunit [bacterium]|nr:acetyl-CoA carboxylase biotin carboxylase subunit [bacterium]